MMLRNKYDYDTFILGGGAAGLAAARLLAREGKRIAVAEPATPGGYEQTRGYGLRAPLIEAARLFAGVRNAPEVGIRGGSVGYNYPTLREWSVRSGRVAPSLKAELTHAGVTFYENAARFVGPHELSLGPVRVTSAQFLICTGSKPVVPAIGGLSGVDYLTPESAVDLLRPPKSVFIIGGGKTGTEFAGLFGSFGSTVTIAEIAPRLLPDEDTEAGDAVKDRITERGGDVLTSTRITGVTKEGTLHRITYLRGDVEHVVKAEHVLLAAGRTPVLDLGLENADVDYSPLGISVNEYAQTSAKHIYAAGSVTGELRGPEGAVVQAEAASLNLLRREKTVAPLRALPKTVYSQPVIASVGTNEAGALRKDISIVTGSCGLLETVAGTAARDDGLVKLIADRRGALIGATVIGADAGEINLLMTMVDLTMSIEKISRLPFAYGSFGEAVTIAARRLLAGD